MLRLTTFLLKDYDLLSVVIPSVLGAICALRNIPIGKVLIGHLLRKWGNRLVSDRGTCHTRIVFIII